MFQEKVTERVPDAAKRPDSIVLTIKESPETLERAVTGWYGC